MKNERSRPVYLLLVVAAVILGMASRNFRSELPTFIGTYAGDILWAAMIFFLAATRWNKICTRTLAAGALLFCLGIELSQLYYAPWIDAIRSTRLGGLALGFGFLPSDVICYFVGVCLAAAVDMAWRSKEVIRRKETGI